MLLHWPFQQRFEPISLLDARPYTLRTILCIAVRNPAILQFFFYSLSAFSDREPDGPSYRHWSNIKILGCQ